MDTFGQFSEAPLAEEAAYRRLPANLPRVLQPTRPVRRTCVAQTYDSPGAVCADIMQHLTPWCIYGSIKSLHKDEALPCSPFIHLSPRSLGQIYVGASGQEVDKCVVLMKKRGCLKAAQKVSVFCQSPPVLLSTFMSE